MQIASNIKDLNAANAAAAEQREQAVQSNLARLLATENLHVAFRKAKTASFNVKTRVLTIPIYAADLPREVVQMLVGHEIGHALFTPAEGWHETACVRGMMYKGYMNVVEDARIERKVKDKYPGLRRDFHFGYAHLINAGFFGSARQAKDPRFVAGLSLIDKVNLHFKAGQHVPAIRFTERELELVDAVQEAETFEQVLTVTDAIWAYDRDYRARLRKEREEARKRQEELLKKLAEKEEQDDDFEFGSGEGEDDREEDDGLDSHDKQDEMPKPSDDNEDDLSDMDKDTESEDPAVDDEETAERGDDGEVIAGESATKEDGSFGAESDDSDEGPKGSGGGAGGDEEYEYGSDEGFEGSVTDRAFRNQEATLVDPSCRDILYAEVKGVPEEKEVKIPFKTVLAKMNQTLMHDATYQVRGARGPEAVAAWVAAEEMKFLQDFRKKHERYVVHLVREFEMKRNAWTAARARESRSGTLNLTKMYQYKFNDDLFKKVTLVPNGKNHGMMMVVDFSGSMGTVIEHVLEQAAVLAMFCRRVQIPFRVFGFTNPDLDSTERSFGHKFPNAPKLHSRVDRYAEMYNSKDTSPTVKCEQYVLTELLSDRMSLRDFNRALFCFFGKFGRRASQLALPMNATPLNDAILTIPSLVKNMRNEYRVEKVSVIVLTDGQSDSDNMTGVRQIDPAQHRLFVTSPWTKKVFEVKAVKRISGYRSRPTDSYESIAWTKAYIQMAEEASGASIIGYHVVSGKKASGMLSDYEGFYTETRDNMKLNFRNNKMMAIDDFGYKQYFVMWDKALTEEDKTMAAANSDMTARRLATMFTDAQRSQQVNRIFLSQFVQMIA